MKDLSFNIDINDVIAEFSLSSGDVKTLAASILEQVSIAIKKNWVDAAKRELHSTRQGYIRGIVIVREGDLKNAIVLKGKFNNMLEAGISSFDMKAGFSKSSKAKMSKDGKWYLRIPFRMASEGSLGESSVFAGVLPKGIQDILKQRAGQTQMGGKVSSGKGLKAEEIPKALATLGKNKTSGYVHKSSIYEGLQKSEKFYEEKKQGQYFSIRTASAKSDPNSWIHSGIKAYNFAEKALRNSNLQIIVDNEIDRFIAGITKK